MRTIQGVFHNADALKSHPSDAQSVSSGDVETPYEDVKLKIRWAATAFAAESLPPNFLLCDESFLPFYNSTRTSSKCFVLFSKTKGEMLLAASVSM